MGIVPYESMGQYSFQRVFGGQDDEQSVKCIELSNGNFLFAGNTNSETPKSYLACFTKEGTPIWSKTFRYKNRVCDMQINSILEASDGNIYIGRKGWVWGANNPTLTILSKTGEILFDSAYNIPPNVKMKGAGINYLIDEPSSNGLVCICTDYLKYTPMNAFQKIRYSGERLVYKEIPEINGLTTLGFYHSKGSLGYTLLCDTLGIRKYLVFLDTSGNFISKRLLFTHLRFEAQFTHTDNGSFIFMLNPENYYLGDVIFMKFSALGDSILYKENQVNLINGLMLTNSTEIISILGNYLFNIDTNLNVIDSIEVFNQLDSIFYRDVNRSKDGGLIGVGEYFGGTCNWKNNMHDYYLFKTYPTCIFNPDINYVLTGIAGEQTDTSPTIVFPNPANKELHIQSKYTSLVTELYSMQGQKMITQSGEVISTATLSSGIYLLNVKNNKGEIVHQQKISVLHE